MWKMRVVALACFVPFGMLAQGCCLPGKPSAELPQSTPAVLRGGIPWLREDFHFPVWRCLNIGEGVLSVPRRQFESVQVGMHYDEVVGQLGAAVREEWRAAKYSSSNQDFHTKPYAVQVRVSEEATGRALRGVLLLADGRVVARIIVSENARSLILFWIDIMPNANSSEVQELIRGQE